jgi:aminoglycoside/choline kinase family phosphotransferase
MVVGDAPRLRGFPANPGILDFQDAVYGPLTYDLVSLYRDAYITGLKNQELDFVIRYWEAARQAGLPVQADFHDFYRDYEWMGAQRQLKVLGIFARLCHRDGKDRLPQATCRACWLSAPDLPALQRVAAARQTARPDSRTSGRQSATPSDEGDDPRRRSR